MGRCRLEIFNVRLFRLKAKLKAPFSLRFSIGDHLLLTHDHRMCIQLALHRVSRKATLIPLSSASVLPEIMTSHHVYEEWRSFSKNSMVDLIV